MAYPRAASHAHLARLPRHAQVRLDALYASPYPFRVACTTAEFTMPGKPHVSFDLLTGGWQTAAGHHRGGPEAFLRWYRAQHC